MKIVKFLISFVMLVNIMACDNHKGQKESLALNFNPYFQFNDSILMHNLTKYVNEINSKYPNSDDTYRFWELYILHSTSHYARVMVKKWNYELLSTATGYFTIGKDVFIIHTGLEQLADRDTTFVYNLLRINSKENYKLIHEFRIPDKDTNLSREFILVADTVLINIK